MHVGSSGCVCRFAALVEWPILVDGVCNFQIERDALPAGSDVRAKVEAFTHKPTFVSSLAGGPDNELTRMPMCRASSA